MSGALVSRRVDRGPGPSQHEYTRDTGAAASPEGAFPAVVSGYAPEVGIAVGQFIAVDPVDRDSGIGGLQVDGICSDFVRALNTPSRRHTRQGGYPQGWSVLLHQL